MSHVFLVCLLPVHSSVIFLGYYNNVWRIYFFFFFLAVFCFCVFFFFFQSEDGIRDWSVTGVQTCALPICSELWYLGRFTGPSISVGPHTSLTSHPARSPRSHVMRCGSGEQTRCFRRELISDRKSVV